MLNFAAITAVQSMALCGTRLPVAKVEAKDPGTILQV